MANQPDEARPQPPDEGGTPKPPEAVTPSVAPVAKSGEEKLAAVQTPAETPSPEPPASTPPPLETEIVPAVQPVEAPSVPEVHAGESGSVPVDSHGNDPYHEPHHDSYHELGAHHDEHGHYHGGSGGYHDEHGHYHSHGESSGHHSGGSTSESEDPLLEPAEEGGGPVKTFLEHLEDFRWLMIKCAAAIAITMTVCLLGVNYLVKILEWPLERAALLSVDKRQYVSVKFGPKEIISFRTDTNQITGLVLGTNRFVELELVAMDLGSNKVMVIQMRTNSNQVPANKAKPLIYLDPVGPFINSLHLAFFGGALIAAPFVFYYIAQFLLPALRPRERKYFVKALTPAVLLFISGVCLCYFILLPLALRATEQYSLWMGVEMPFWRAEGYFGFVTKFMLGMGLGFEMPVLLLALVKIGLLDYRKLAGFRRYMVLINLVLGALLTTPEVITQVAMFIPLQFLYEVSIWIAWYWEQPDRAYAQRRAVGVLIAIILSIVLLWLGIKYGWPWLRQLMNHP